MEKKELKIGILVGLTFTFFVLELVGGYVVSSIALIADSFHMLSDVASLIIALVATRLSKSKNFGSDLSYGLQRAEVLGALINGVSLLALCFTLIISAIQRLFTPEEITNPFIVLYVASAGLIVNIIGLTLFHNHSHSGHNHAFKRVEEVDPMILLEEAENPIYFRENVIRVAEKIMERQGGGDFGIDHEEISTPVEMQNSCATIENHDHDGGHTHHDLNMHGVFLHVLGDLLASVGVIVSAVIIIYIKDPWTLYVDPVVSALITMIIVKATIPLVKSASFILLQGTPPSVSVDILRKDILKLKGVADVHELHVWQLSNTQTIASVHVVVPRPVGTSATPYDEDWYMDLAARIKNLLHSHGIHSTTVQPEFVTCESPGSGLPVPL